MVTLSTLVLPHIPGSSSQPSERGTWQLLGGGVWGRLQIELVWLQVPSTGGGGGGGGGRGFLRYDKC